MPEKLVEVIDNLGAPRVAVVGGFMVDRYVWGAVDRISPEAPVPVLKVTEEEDRLGGAGRVLHDIAALGAKVDAIGVVGDDSPGHFFVNRLESLGIGTSGLIVDRNRRTTLKMRLMARAQHAYRVDYDTDVGYSSLVEKRFLNKVVKKLAHLDALLISDYSRQLPSDRLIQRIINAAGRAGVPVLVDPARGADYSRYRNATVITPNRYEAAEAVAANLETLHDVEKAARRLVRSHGLQAAVITLDKDGLMVFSRRGKPVHVPTRPRAVYDVTGAGDVVLAVLGLVVAAGHDVVTAARIANAAAGIEVEKMGAVPVTLNELRLGMADLQQLAATKLKRVNELVPILNEHRARKEKVVLTNGCFDLIHAGHIAYMNFARAQGDVLVVGLNSDRSVRAIKGRGRPIQGEIERAMVLASLAHVDYVVIFSENSVLNLIKTLQPDVLVKGADYRERDVVGAGFVKGRGGKVVLAPYVNGMSTTDVIGKVLDRYGNKKG